MTCPKRRYPSALDARIALSLMREGAKRREARAYRCPECKGWHLTSLRERKATP